MADLTQTAANVVQGSTARIRKGTAGAVITAGMPLYMDAADGNKLKPADADASALTAAVVGIALTGGAANQPIAYVEAGLVNLGATLTVGAIYVLSGTAGGICPEADLATGDWVTVLGIAVSAVLLDLRVNVSGVQVP
jgi:hypothetical protein